MGRSKGRFREAHLPRISDYFFHSVEECVAVKGAHVIDLVVRGEKGSTLVEVFIDADGPVSGELCAELSRAIGDTIDTHDFVRGAYRLIVSSPGIDRPLKHPWQYRKHIGRPFELRVRDGEMVSTVSGTLVETNENEIVVESRTTRLLVHVRFEAIIEARVKAPW